MSYSFAFSNIVKWRESVKEGRHNYWADVYIYTHWWFYYLLELLFFRWLPCFRSATTIDRRRGLADGSDWGDGGTYVEWRGSLRNVDMISNCFYADDMWSTFDANNGFQGQMSNHSNQRGNRNMSLGHGGLSCCLCFWSSRCPFWIQNTWWLSWFLISATVLWKARLLYRWETLPRSCQ